MDTFAVLAIKPSSKRSGQPRTLGPSFSCVCVLLLGTARGEGPFLPDDFAWLLAGPSSRDTALAPRSDVRLVTLLRMRTLPSRSLEDGEEVSVPRKLFNELLLLLDLGRKYIVVCVLECECDAWRLSLDFVMMDCKLEIDIWRRTLPHACTGLGILEWL
jgi:hypothetical protein